MSRSLIASPPPAPSAVTAPGGLQSSTYRIKVVTPLFGGGTTPRKLDPLEQTRIRVPSVRGHLRWWFRATLGGRYSNADALREAESSIFGSTSRASQVSITAKVTSLGRPVARDELNLQQGDRLFPVFPSDVDNIRLGVEFDLTLQYPEAIRQDLETVLWAWTTFGGIGAKTRRGCGALYCKEFAAKAYKDRKNAVLQKWSERVDQGPSPLPWPRLHQLPIARLNVPPQSDLSPVAAWRQGIELYRTFRHKGPEGHGIGTFDSLGFAGNAGRMASPVLLRPVVWADGASAAPMVVPLFTDRSDSREAVQAVLSFFQRQHKFKPVEEY